VRTENFQGREGDRKKLVTPKENHSCSIQDCHSNYFLESALSRNRRIEKCLGAKKTLNGLAFKHGQINLIPNAAR